MGLGCVLILWAIIGTVLAVGAGVTLAVICFLILRKRTSVGGGWILAFGMAPFLCGLYCFIAFIVYGTWCEKVRGVDFGTGDGFRVPLGNQYAFEAIDVPSNAFLVGPDGKHLHGGFESLGISSEFIYGEDETSKCFLIDAPKRSEITLKDTSELLATLRQRGVSEPELLAPEEFYQKHRFGLPDLLAAILIVVPPGIGFLTLSWSFYRTLRGNACEDADR